MGRYVLVFIRRFIALFIFGECFRTENHERHNQTRRGENIERREYRFDGKLVLSSRLRDKKRRKNRIFGNLERRFHRRRAAVFESDSLVARRFGRFQKI